MGRLAKPLKVHQMAGSYRPDRHGGLPSGPPPGEPIRPDGLIGPAGAFWDVVTPGLVQAGAVGGVDSFGLEAMARVWGLAAAAMTAAEADPTSKALRSAVTGYTQLFTLLAGKFGLTPGDRARLRLDLAANVHQLDPMDEFLARGCRGGIPMRDRGAGAERPTG
jgi:hypothetical protein